MHKCWKPHACRSNWVCIRGLIGHFLWNYVLCTYNVARPLIKRVQGVAAFDQFVDGCVPSQATRAVSTAYDRHSTIIQTPSFGWNVRECTLEWRAKVPPACPFNVRRGCDITFVSPTCSFGKKMRHDGGGQYAKCFLCKPLRFPCNNSKGIFL